MLGHKLSSTILALAGLIALSACTDNGNSNLRGSLAGGDTSGGLSSQIEPQSGAIVQCAVDVSPSVVNSGDSATLTFRAAGGTAPYRINTTSGNYSFTSQIALNATYTNAGSSNVLVQKTATIYDANNNAGSCSWQVTVRPASSSGGSGGSGVYGCAITGNTSPLVNVATQFQVVPSVAGVYTLQDLYLSDTWVQHPNVQASGATPFNVTYTSAGPRTITAVISQNGILYSCALPINVRTLGLGVDVSPSYSAAIGGTITLTPRPSGFLSTPAYSVSSSDSAVSITASGSNYLVTSSDGKYHAFKVTFTASEGSASVTTAVNLAFTNGLQCTVGGSATVETNTDVSFQIMASNSTDAIAYDSVNLDLNGVLLASAPPVFRARYTGHGQKTLNVVGARSVRTGEPCNTTGNVQKSVKVVDPLAGCSLVSSTGSNPALVGTTIQVQAKVPDYTGFGPFTALLTAVSGPSNFNYLYDAANMSKGLRFNTPGTYGITMVVTDTNDGTSVSCSTALNVSRADTFAIGQDGGRKVQVLKTSVTNEILASNGFEPFSDVLPNFAGGIRVATADVTGDGIVDIITAAGVNGGMQVRVFDGTNLNIVNNVPSPFRSFTAFTGYNLNSNRLNVAAGDVTGDGAAEVVVAPGCDASMSLIQIYGAHTGKVIAQFTAFDGSGGADVALADVDGDGSSDVIAASCTSSEVKVFSGQDILNADTGVRPAPIYDFFSQTDHSINTRISASDLNGDGYADIITGTNGASASQVKVFSGKDGSLLLHFQPFTHQGINYIGAVQFNKDATGNYHSDILVSSDPFTGDAGEVRIFNGVSGAQVVGPLGTMGVLKPFSSYPNRLFVSGGAGGLF